MGGGIKIHKVRELDFVFHFAIPAIHLVHENLTLEGLRIIRGLNDPK